VFSIIVKDNYIVILANRNRDIELLIEKLRESGLDIIVVYEGLCG